MITENKQIAAIILNYFGFDDTIKCINSVQKNLRSAIFLIDNSANQNEKTKLRKVFKNNKNIHMLFPSRNLGFAAGVNLGISEAINKGFKRFFLLNNDTILLNGAEVQLKNAFNKYPTAIIAPAIKWRDYINKGNYYHRYFGLIDNDCIVRSSGWLYYFTGCALAFDIAFLEKVGNFNEKFFMYGEDVELIFRAQEKGVSLKLLENEFVIHEGSKSAIMASFFYEYHMARSHYLLCFLLFKSPFKKATAFLGKLFPLAIRACIRSLRYKSLAPLAALLLAPIPLRIRPKQR